jgi:hypothetical protein
LLGDVGSGRRSNGFGLGSFGGDFGAGLCVSFSAFQYRRFFHGPLGPLDDSHATLGGGFFLGEVLVANLFCQLFRNRVGRNADVNAFASHLFNEPLCVEL